VRAIDIAFVGPDRVLALASRGGRRHHAGFELRQVTGSGIEKTGIELPLLSWPRMTYDDASRRWTVIGGEQALSGRFRGLLADGAFILELPQGSVDIGVTSSTVFDGCSSVDDLEIGHWVVVEEAGPGHGDNVAAVVRTRGTSTPFGGSDESVLLRLSGELGSRSYATTRWSAEAAKTVTWTPLDTDHALAQWTIDGPPQDLDLTAPAPWIEDGRPRPRFALSEIHRLGSRRLAEFESAVVCRAAAAGPGSAVCTASNDRDVSVWRATVGDDGIVLSPVLSFRSPFVSPAVVTREVSILTGPMAGAIAVDHGPRRAGRLQLPEGTIPISLIPVGDREFALMATRGMEHTVFALRLPDPLS
jgi:hypothetical protein